MNPLAEELNRILDEKSPLVLKLLSKFGKEIYFPKGILSQSQEANEKAHKFNATLGIATEGGHPMFLPSVDQFINNIHPRDVYPYAPAAGKQDLRKLRLKKIYNDNPRLNDKKLSLPIVTCGITHGLSLVGDLFVDPEDCIILPDKFWGNYRLMYEVRYGGKITTFPLFNDMGGLSVSQFRTTVEKCGKEKKKLIILLNFPNNPTGYTPTAHEAGEIRDVIIAQAKKGNEIVVVTDDAYFGLFYEDSINDSIFSYLVGKHKNILVVKLDGSTKEEYAWGFRIGFITFGLGDLANSDEIYAALEKKVMGGIRSTLSNASHLSQTLILKSIESPDYDSERKEKFEILKDRAYKVKEVLKNEKYSAVWSLYPFNSGYFMCLQLKNVNAEDLRKHLLNKYGVGVIATGDKDVRIAFSCVDIDKIEELFEIIYLGAKEIE